MIGARPCYCLTLASTSGTLPAATEGIPQSQGKLIRLPSKLPQTFGISISVPFATLQARPLPRDVTFHVHESAAPLTVPEGLHLQSDVRALERAAFDRAMEERERLKEVRRWMKSSAFYASIVRVAALNVSPPSFYLQGGTAPLDP